MEDIFKDVEPMVYKSKINVPYQWWAGDTAGRFFTALRDEQKIYGTRCTACDRTFVPPRKNCPLCFGANEEWVQVSSRGKLVSFTVVRRQLASLPGKVPVMYGLVQLDGSDTALLHIIDNAKSEDLSIGMEMEAVFADDRTGTIMDIACFRPVKKE